MIGVNAPEPASLSAGDPPHKKSVDRRFKRGSAGRPPLLPGRITGTTAGGAPATLSNQPPPPPPPTPMSFGNLTGFWTGSVGIQGRGMCSLQINLLETAAAPGHFGGTAQIPCVPERSLNPPGSSTPAQDLLNRTNPEAAQISGLMGNNALHMGVDTNLRADTHGCYFVSLDLSPFGPNQLAAKWQEAPPCHGGVVIIKKVR